MGENRRKKWNENFCPRARNCLIWAKWRPINVGRNTGEKADINEGGIAKNELGSRISHVVAPFEVILAHFREEIHRSANVVGMHFADLFQSWRVSFGNGHKIGGNYFELDGKENFSTISISSWKFLRAFCFRRSEFSLIGVFLACVSPFAIPSFNPGECKAPLVLERN